MRKIISILLGLTALVVIAQFGLPAIQNHIYASDVPILPVTPSATSYPMLSRDEAKPRIIELLQTNAGCRLPCWWGIVPGKTRWEEVHAFLSPMLTAESVTNDYLSFIDPASSWDAEDPMLPNLEMYVRDSIVQDILVDPVSGKYLTELDIPHIFEAYGKPDEIYLRVFNYETARLIQIFLHYPSLRLTIQYNYFLDIHPTIRLCSLDQAEHADFYLWYGDLATDFWYGSRSVAEGDFYAIAARAGWYPTSNKILALSEATDLTVEAFYEMFRQPIEYATCLKTPTSLWVENHN
jgi:hypothetical protein